MALAQPGKQEDLPFGLIISHFLCVDEVRSQYRNIMPESQINCKEKNNFSYADH